MSASRGSRGPGAVLAVLAACAGAGTPAGTGDAAVPCNPFGGGCPAEGEAESEGEPCDPADGGVPRVQSCFTACGTGRRLCVQGRWTPCTARAPEQERCDGVDNDCDGDTDETCACREGVVRSCGMDVGACTRGLERCLGGAWTECDGGREPRQETCDRLDDDCDGQVDEGCECEPGALQPCGPDLGVCESGEQRCEEGFWGACQGGVPPRGEACDGRDDDCDGATDELWAPDALEPNDAEDRPAALPGVPENGAPMFRIASLAPSGDVDFYRLDLQEQMDLFCIPFLTREPDYRVTIALGLPAGADPGAWRMCATRPGESLCADQGTYDSASGEHRLTACWDGGCGQDDARDYLLRVSADGGACGDYTLRVEFVQPDESCGG